MLEEGVYNKEYIFLDLVSQVFKFDLWIPQTYLRGNKVLDVIGRQKYIIGGGHSEKSS